MNNLNLEGILSDNEDESYYKDLIQRCEGPFPEQEDMKILVQQPDIKPMPAPEEELTRISAELEELDEKIETISMVEGLECLEEGNDVNYAIALNEASLALVDDMLQKVEKALQSNRNKQGEIIRKKRARLEMSLRTHHIQMYLPPYFKDEHGMTAPLSDEARTKMDNFHHDPLEREEKKWTPAEIVQLKQFVRDAMAEIHIASLSRRRELICEKIRNAPASTPIEQMQTWQQEFDRLQRQIAYENNTSLEILHRTVDVAEIDWVKMANLDFKGLRSPRSLRLKWINDLSPRWNQEPWSKEEEVSLKKLVEKELFISWPVVAEQLGTSRSPWHCFERYKSKLQDHKRSWSAAEDEKLIALVNMLKVRDEVPWEKVAYYMPGRSKSEARIRYTQSLNRAISRGNWTSDEDILLMSAVSRVGCRRWCRISRYIPGRTDAQCRERWFTIMNKKNEINKWTMEEDEKLILLTKIFGRGHWGKCMHFFDGRTGDGIRNRYTTLLNMKVRAILQNTDNKILDDENVNQDQLKQKDNRHQAFFDKFNDLLNEANSGSVRVQEIIDNVVANSEFRYNCRSAVTKEDVVRIKKDLDEVSRLYRDANNKIDMDILVDLIDVQARDVKNYVQRRNRDRLRGQKKKEQQRKVREGLDEIKDREDDEVGMVSAEKSVKNKKAEISAQAETSIEPPTKKKRSLRCRSG